MSSTLHEYAHCLGPNDFPHHSVRPTVMIYPSGGSVTVNNKCISDENRTLVLLPPYHLSEAAIPLGHVRR
jgi:hypothetical protein